MIHGPRSVSIRLVAVPPLVKSAGTVPVQPVQEERFVNLDWFVRLKV